MHSFILISFMIGVSAGATEPIFEGPSEQQIQEFRKKLPVAFDGSLTMFEVDELIRLITSSNEFESVAAHKLNNGDIKITASPIRKISSIVVKGADSASRSEIYRIIGVEEGEKFERRKILDAGESLKAFYGDLGYFNAIIEVSFEKQGSNQLRITFDITEGLACEVKKVEIKTENEELKQKLTRRVRRYLGDHLTLSTVRNLGSSMSDYLLDRQFLRAEIKGPEASYNDDKSQAVLSYTITDPYAYQVFTKGYADPITKFDIRQAMALDEYEKSSLDPTNEITSRVREYYLKRGYPSVKVSSKVETLENSFVRRLHLIIEQGPHVKISEWVIDGRISRPEDYYIEFIEENSSSLIKSGYYNRSDLELGQKNLITELRNQGFLMAKIQSARIEYLGHDKSKAKITINLDEGPLTQVRKIEFEGNTDFTDLELSEMLLIKSNSPLRLKQLEISIDRLKNFYLDRGYLEMKLLNSDKEIVQYNDKGTQANILFKLYEGPQIRVNSIIVEGNDFTKSDVVLRALTFEKGEILTPEKIQDSQLLLNRMGIFSRVSIATVEEGTNVASRTVVIKIVEREPGLLRFGAGVNNERDLTARGFLGLSYNNLWGTARGISGRAELSSNVADINYLEHRITIGYLEPFLFGSRTRGRINLTRSDEVFNTKKVESETLVSILTRDRIDFLLERDLTRHTRFTWTLWGLESRTQRERHGRCFTDEEISLNKCDEDTQQVVTIGPVLDVDYRDNSFLPTRGSYSRLGLEYSAPALGSSTGIEFAKVEGTYRYYIPLTSSRFVWANEVRSGYLSNLSDRDDSGVPTSYAFFLGGYSTVRGYEFTSDLNRIPEGNPEEGEGRYLPVTDATALIIKSDSYFYMVKSELRFPVWGELGGVVFYDGGAVLVSGYDFDRPYREAVGFGIRYNTPVGPVSFDVGYKINPQRDEDKYRFHFSIGTF